MGGGFVVFNTKFIELHREVARYKAVGGRIAVLRGKLGRVDQAIIRPSGFTLAVKSKSLPMLTAPTLMTLVRGTTVLTMTTRLPRKTAAINTGVSVARIHPSNRNRRIRTRTALIRIRKQGLAFSLITESSTSIVNRNARVHCVISETGFLLGLGNWPSLQLLQRGRCRIACL